MKYQKIALAIVIALSFVSYAYFEGRTTRILSAGLAVILILLYMYLEKKNKSKKNGG